MKQTTLIAFFALFLPQLYAQTAYLDKNFLPCAADTSVYYYNVSERMQISDTAFSVKISLKNSISLYAKMTYRDSSTTIQNGSAIFFESDGKSKRSAGNFYNNKKQGEWRFYTDDKLNSSYMYKADLKDGDAHQYFDDGSKNKFATLKNDKFVGAYLYLHQDGKTIKIKGQYKEGKEEGEWTSFYDNGVQASAETFSNGELVAYKLYDEDGKKMKNKNYKTEQKPEFSGGEIELMRYLSSNIIYPQEARENNIEGKVFLGFVVEKNGEISTVKVLRSPHRLLSIESIRVVNKMPNWSGGRQHNIPVRVQYTLPIQFKLD